MNLLEQTFIKNEYPAMPQDIRDMVNEEVIAQMEDKTSKNNFNKKLANKRALRPVKAAALGLALGTAMVGAVVASEISRLHAEKNGRYAVEISMESGKDGNSGEIKESKADIPKVSMEINGQPEGMIFDGLQSGSCKICVFEKDGRHPATIYLFSLVDGYETFKVNDKNVKSTEEFVAGENPATYVELAYVESGAFQETSKVYIVYPSLNHMVLINGYNGMSREEMMQLAKGIVLKKAEPADEGQVICEAMELKAGETPFGTGGNNKENVYADDSLEERKIFASREEFLSNLHKAGDEIKLDLNGDLAIDGSGEKVSGGGSYKDSGMGIYKDSDGNGYGDSNKDSGEGSEPAVALKLSEIKVCGNIKEVPEGLYNHVYGAEIKKKCDENGNFIPEEIQYVNYGNGVDTVDEVVKSETVQEKLLVLTFEYTNISSHDIDGFLFQPGHIATVRESSGGYEIYNYETLAREAGVDAVVGRHYESWGGCAGWDNGGDASRKNSIGDFKAGETRTVRSAFFVNENELSNVYLNVLSTFEDNGAFGDGGEYIQPLEAGYFDVRQ